jgi:hypothetical protein
MECVETGETATQALLSELKQSYETLVIHAVCAWLNIR